MDGKHIRIVAPSLSGSTHHNYKGYFSLVLLAIVYPNYKFLVVDIGSSGSRSDGGIFSRSNMGRKFEASEMGLLPPKIVGDDAFPLKPHIMGLTRGG